jgi:hypothetical protein
MKRDRSNCETRLWNCDEVVDENENGHWQAIKNVKGQAVDA